MSIAGVIVGLPAASACTAWLRGAWPSARMRSRFQRVQTLRRYSERTRNIHPINMNDYSRAMLTSSAGKTVGKATVATAK